MKTIHIEGRRWRDRINGNTYHSCRVYVDGELAVTCPFQYGDGDQYVWTGWEALVGVMNLPVEHYASGGLEAIWRWCDRNGVKCSYQHADVLKRDCQSFGGD